jgi:hypothetical protein
MKRSWLEIYGLAVCFFTAAYFVFAFGEAAWRVIELSAPEFTLSSHQWERHQSDETFRETLINQRRCNESKCAYEPPSGAALTAERERSLAVELRSEQRNALQQLVRNLINLFIDVVVFFAHWRIAAHARRNPG